MEQSANPSISSIPIISTEDLAVANEFISKCREEEGRKIVGTHSGVFHCDEVLGCALLTLTNEFKTPAIIRTRNTEIHKLVDILLDVGDVFDPEAKRFDHHQKTFEGYFHGEKKEGEQDDKFATKMSSAGLIFKYFGQEIIVNLASKWNSNIGNTEEEVTHTIEELHSELYNDFIKEIDAIDCCSYNIPPHTPAIDNGVSQFKNGYIPRYRISTGLGTRISRLNPSWNAEDQSPNRPFLKGMSLAEEEFIAQIYAKLMIVRPAYNIAKEAFEQRQEFHASGELIFLKQVCPWKSHLYKIEEETKNEGLIKFALFKSPEGMYRVQAVSVNQHSFENRVSLLAEWRGKRDDELKTISGIQSIKFVHHSGFIGGAYELEDAIKMAELSLNAVSK